jgi:hypothetical protein
LRFWRREGQSRDVVVSFYGYDDEDEDEPEDDPLNPHLEVEWEDPLAPDDVDHDSIPDDQETDDVGDEEDDAGDET